VRKVAISAQASAVVTIVGMIDGLRQLRASERDLLRERLSAAGATLQMIARHEDAVRATIREAEEAKRGAA